ncbi:MAG: transcriptional repressor [Planctomycetes bacterium]|nr:transcriptional repressor [Planctomycetota bacterium]
MWNSKKKTTAALREAGLRVTRQRMKAMAAIGSAGRPVCAREVLESIGGGGIDRATVYRAVRDLEEAGLIHHSYSVGRTSYYESADHCGEDACHPHFRCRKCGKTSCLYDAVVGGQLSIPPGYKVERRKMLLIGLCPACSA